MSDEKDAVGYKKPPRSGQFKPGQSGNPNGRPKGSKNMATLMDEELSVQIPITENGKHKKISKRRAAAKQLANKAASGDPKFLTILLSDQRARESQPAASAQDTEPFSEADDIVIGNIVERIRRGETGPTDTTADSKDTPHQGDAEERGDRS